MGCGGVGGEKMKAFVDPWTLLELELKRSSQIVCTEYQKEKQRKKGREEV